MHDVREVILSGGDPLMLPNGKIAELLKHIEKMEHVERIRIHTRMVTAVPERIDADICNNLQATGKKIIIVTHVNHADELDDATDAAIAKLRATGTLVLNQSVLLRGVNDTVDVLVALSEKLISQGVLPYYLHQLDRVVGAAHFEVPTEEGRAIVESMRDACPGYMVPRYVTEIPGAPSKVSVL
jgi:KamA family protein